MLFMLFINFVVKGACKEGVISSISEAKICGMYHFESLVFRRSPDIKPLRDPRVHLIYRGAIHNLEDFNGFNEIWIIRKDCDFILSESWTDHGLPFCEDLPRLVAVGLS